MIDWRAIKEAMIWLYRLLFLPMLLALGPYYLLRMLKRGGYGRHFKQRLGLVPRLPPKQAGLPRIWIQAVSVGELLAVAPLIRMLQQHRTAEVILTTTTSTGYTILDRSLRGNILAGALFPLDFYPCTRHAWGRIQPDCVILMEGELWPEHLHQAARARIPALLVNARLSDRSFRRYQRFETLARHLLQHLSGIHAGSAQDARRFQALAGGRTPVSCAGNLKFDVEITPILSASEKAKLTEELGFADAAANETRGGTRPLILLGCSTWPGEEVLLLRILACALADGLDCRLLLVPRHAERGAELQALLQQSPFAWRRRSNGACGGAGNVRVYLGDTTGELTLFTQLADLAFIGKSLSPNEGGQTPVEAAALGIPSLFGPAMSNFREMSKSLVHASAARLCPDADSVVRNCLHLLKTPTERERMASAACAWHRANRGAAQRIFAAIQQTLGQMPRKQQPPP